MADRTVHDTVQLVRVRGRWTNLGFFEEIFDSLEECHGDRLFVDDEATVGRIARLDGKLITATGIQKGWDLQENTRRNLGSPHPEGYRKVLRLMKQAEKFNRPAIILINTAGAYCGVRAEERGEGEVIVRNLPEMSDLKVPIVAIIIDEGGSGGALALGLADEVWMLEETTYAVLSPEGSASILWKDGSRTAEAAELTKITASELRELGIVDRVIPGTFNGEQLPRYKVTHIAKKALIERLMELVRLDQHKLLEKRYKRFRQY